jgi:hypothetical protein
MVAQSFFIHPTGYGSGRWAEAQRLDTGEMLLGSILVQHRSISMGPRFGVQRFTRELMCLKGAPVYEQPSPNRDGGRAVSNPFEPTDRLSSPDDGVLSVFVNRTLDRASGELAVWIVWR